MGLIKDKDRYNNDNTISNDDYLIGTDEQDGKRTKTYLLSDLIAFIATQADGLSQDNIFTEIDLGTRLEGESLATLANNLDAYTISDSVLPIYKVTTTPISPSSLPREERFVVLLRGKGDYGVGGTALADEDFFALNPVQAEVIRNSTIISSLLNTNQIIRGSVAYSGTGLIYESTYYTYTIGGTFYEAQPDNNIVISAGGAEPRIDVVAGDTDGNITVIEGTPSANPVKPALLDYETQIELTNIDVAALSTSPTINQETIYYENLGEPTEWEVSDSTGGVRIIKNSTLNSYEGTFSIRVNSPVNSDNFSVTKDTSINTDDYEELVFRMKLDDPFGNSAIKVVFLLGGIPVQAAFAISDGRHGFDASNTTDYQLLVIPLPQNELAVEFDQILFELSGVTGGQVMHIDNMRLTGGVTNPSDSVIPERTSQLINDGEDGINPFITSNDVTLQLATENDNVTTETILVDLGATFPSTGFKAYEDNGASASLGISSDSGTAVGSLELKNENLTGFTSISVQDTLATPNLLFVPNRPDSTPRVLSVGASDGVTTAYSGDDGVIDLSSLNLSNLQAVLNAGNSATDENTGDNYVEFVLDEVITANNYIDLQIYDTVLDIYSNFYQTPTEIRVEVQDDNISAYGGLGFSVADRSPWLNSSNNGGSLQLGFHTDIKTDNQFIDMTVPTGAANAQRYFMPLSVNGNFSDSDAEITVGKTTTANTALSVDVSNPLGNDCNMLVANTADNTDTITPTGTGGWAKILVNSASEPAVGASAVKEAGGTFQANQDMYLNIYHDADGYKYFWTYVTSVPDIDADTLTGLTADQFLRSDVADIKTVGDLTFNDNVSLILGTGGDNKFYHDGTNQLRLDLINNDFFVIRDNTTNRFTFSKTDGLFACENIQTDSYKSTGSIATNNRVVTIGDYDDDYRFTKIIVDDQNKSVSIGDATAVDTGVRIVTNHGTGKITLGDDSAIPVSNGTFIEIDDSNSEVTINAADLNFNGIPTYADDTAAGVGGLTAGYVYMTATGELRIKI